MSFHSEFQLKNFGFPSDGVLPEHFYEVHLMNIPAGALLAYRLVILIYMTVSTALSIWDFNSLHWLQYLTTWSWLQCYIYFICITSISFWYHCTSTNRRREHDVSVRADPVYSEIDAISSENVENLLNNNDTCENNSSDDEPLPKHLKLTWILFESSFGVAFMVTIMYWGFVEVPSDLRTRFIAFLTINEHCVNFVLLLIDFTFHQIPVRLLHAIYPIGFGLCYVVFDVIFAFTKGVVIYDILDWVHSPGVATGYVFAAVVIIGVGQALLYVFYRVRMKMKRSRVVPMAVNALV